MEEFVLNYLASDYYITPRKFLKVVNVRSISLLAWTLITIYIMNCFNALAYSRMPTRDPLPDIFADHWGNYAFLRGSKNYMSSQPADMLSLSLTASTILITALRWDIVNVRKLAYVYNVCLALRIIFFSVTGLPPACIGYPNCPCAVTPYSTIAKHYSIPKIAFIYSFAVGLFLGSMPQCGDLAMSGHTIYLWVLTLYITDAFEKVFSGKILMLIKIVVYLLLIFVTITIILIRNHYTIDILLATVFCNILWSLYTWEAGLINTSYFAGKNSFHARFMCWLEKDQNGHDEDSSNLSDSDILL